MTDPDLQQMYQQIILDHARERHGAGLAETADASSHQINPTCGDEVTVQVRMHDGRIASLSWDGMGCSISQASTSMLHDLVLELTPAAAAEHIAAFRAVVHSRGADPGDADVLGDAVALAGVSRYPARVKCALLGWVALEDALHGIAP
mgnify:CR=1 FL=1